MEDVIKKTSNQINQVYETNNNNNNDDDNNGNNYSLKSRNTKPPLLPKPQFKKGDYKSSRVTNSSSALSEIATNQNAERFLNASVQNGIKSQISKHADRQLEKPPLISPKPQFLSKLNVTNSTISNSLSLPIKTELKFDNSSSEKLSSRPPRSPQKSLHKSESHNTSLIAEESSKILTAGKLKSACTGSNQELNKAVQNLIENPEQLSEFCKQVEMCSRHSHLLKTNFDGFCIQSSIHKLEELDLASDSSVVNFNVVNKISSNQNNSDSKILSCTNNFKKNSNSKEGVVNTSLLCPPNLNSPIAHESPKSFLHQYGYFHNVTKNTAVTSEKTVKKTENISSFLHKHKDQASSHLDKGTLLEQKSKESSQNTAQMSSNSNLDNIATPEESNQSNISKNSDQLLQVDSTISESTSFSKRFQWFGSFGKGGKKEGGKKQRCVSQFYSTSDSNDAIHEKNRTKSLPNIKHSRTVPDINYLPKPSLTTKDSINSDKVDSYPQSDSDDDKDSLNHVEINSEKDCNTRAFLKAKELMTSEEVFIDVLKLLNEDFRNYVYSKSSEGKSNCIPSGEINKILNHLSQLQSLNEDILEDLRKRIKNWENNPKISDVIVKKGAFLKMYTTYIQNFESQTNYLDDCMIKFPKFGKIVKEFEASERCKKLTLKHYMLKPVQRIPQYRLLLNDYLKHLDESSVDYTDTLSALKIVCEVVDHANRNLAHGDKEGRLMHFQSILSDYTLIKPGRDLIKDGPLEKICRKSVKDRYFILLNDCFLHTTYSKQYLKIHQELPLSGMKICYNDDENYPHSFTVHSIKRSFILCAKNESECKEWVEVLQKAIEEHIKKQKTFLNVKIEVNDSFKLGKEAPVWVPDSKVTMCQICTAEFTALFRRHHCRGCGKVICRNCGNNQAPLQYANFKPDRVCDQCFDQLLKDFDNSEDSICNFLKETSNLLEEGARNEYLYIKAKFVKYSSANSVKKSKYIPPRLKEVSANDSESVISGWLYRKSRKSWKMFWYVLKDHVLYVYKASEDVLALETIPVLGYEVERAKINFEDIDKELIFSLVHSSQTPLIFRAESQSSAKRWIEALIAASSIDYVVV